LVHGTSLKTVLGIAREIRAKSEIPILLFTYLNPVLRYGLEKLACDAAAAGIDGCLMTDLSVEEAGQYMGAMRAANLDTVFLAAPTSTPERRKLVAEYSSGFVYLVSRTGVTGEKDSLSDSVGPLVRSMREVTKLPLGVGFGISKPEHAAAVGAVADGVVVGSAFVRIIEQNAGSPDLESKLETYTRELRQALPRRGS
jgi:tryptophan synthase alpha chain